MSVATTTPGRTASEPLSRVVSLLMLAWAWVADLGDTLAAHMEAHEVDTEGMSLAQSLTAKTIGKGLMTVALVVIVLNELFTLSIVNNTTGPFGDLIDTVENLGVAALTLVVIGFIVLGAAVAIGFMDRF